ncbi:toxin-antitoxin system HicB family antitoxin [Candidatus Woesearchaeota archaeon]|nr:toxin-antitoxin system HicB family antitoxin [Candidatus Woesearchaeota archaeon]
MVSEKALWVTPETHHKAKVEAAKAGLSIRSFIEKLLGGGSGAC